MAPPVDDASLLHLVNPAPRLPARARGVRTGGMAAFLFHVLVLLMLVFVGSRSQSDEAAEAREPRVPLQLPRMVFLQAPGPSGGGGGGGRREPRPASAARAVGRDRLTVPAVKPVALAEPPPDRPPEQQAVLIAATTLAADTANVVGLIGAAPLLSPSQGGGVGGGAGEGIGTGSGSGKGPGLGPGTGGGFGGGAYRLGAGVSPPIVIQKVTPRYTAEALRIQIQGTVILEAVVAADGRVTAIRVMRSLDHGLDHEAMVALEQWRFKPGTHNGVPVDVLVSVLLDFRIH